MKTLLCIAVAFFTLSSIAQEQKTKQPITVTDQNTELQDDKAKTLATTETEKLTKQLELTTKQQDRVYTVMFEHFKEKMQNKQKIKQMLTSKDKEDKAKIKKAITKYDQNHSEKLNSQIKRILTEQQYLTYLENQKNE